MSASEFWNDIYSKKPFSGGKAPHSFLVDMIPRLRKGKTLDIGMGEGADAVYLAQKGFEVKGFDVSSVAIEHAQELARGTGVTIEAKQTDLDLFLFGLLEYDTIIMMQFKPSNARYYSEVIRALKQGGTLLVESVMIDEMKEVIGPDEAYRDHYYKTNELLKALSGMRILFYQEAELNGKHVVQCLAQKPLDKDVAKYALFDMQSGPKETKPNVQRELAEALFKKK